MIRRPPRSTRVRSSAASDVYKRQVVSLLAAGIMASPLAYATNGYLPIGYGQKNEAMGGASIALPLDSLASANNPAGMVMVGDRADLGLTLFRPNRTAEITGNNCAPAGCGGGTLNGTYDGNGRSNFFIPTLAVSYTHLRAHET